MFKLVDCSTDMCQFTPRHEHMVHGGEKTKDFWSSEIVKLNIPFKVKGLVKTGAFTLQSYPKSKYSFIKYKKKLGASPINY